MYYGDINKNTFLFKFFYYFRLKNVLKNTGTVKSCTDGFLMKGLTANDKIVRSIRKKFIECFYNFFIIR